MGHPQSSCGNPRALGVPGAPKGRAMELGSLWLDHTPHLLPRRAARWAAWGSLPAGGALGPRNPGSPVPGKASPWLPPGAVPA